MDIEGTYTFQAPIEQVWKTLLDPEVLGRTLPGVEQMHLVGPDHYTATMHVGIGVVKGTYSGSVTILDKQEPSHYRLQAEGNGARGFVKAEGTVDLAQHNGNTIATYKGSAQLGGAIAGVGMRMIGGAAKTLINQFFGTIAQELRAPEQPAVAAAPAAAVPPLAASAAAPAEPAPTSAPQAATRRPTHSAAQPIIPRPAVAQPSLLVQLVRLLKVSDGSQEDEQRWSQRLVLGSVGVMLLLVLLGFLLGRRSSNHSG